MARRVKEEPIVHQNRIADIADVLFTQRGILGTTMDDIANAAGYSKATLYVYFKNKDEIVSFLALKSMSKLRDVIANALNSERKIKDRFFDLCFALSDYQASSPIFFERSLEYIRVDFEEKEDSFLKQTYGVGEEINDCISEFIKTGIQEQEFCECENYFEMIFHMLGMISGLIKIASEKEVYIGKAGGLSKEQFLEDGFKKIYETIAK